MAAKPPSVFISYKRTERHLRDAFLAILETNNIEVVYDSRSLTPGEEFSPEIRKFIDDCSATIVIWTDKSVASKWVRLEAARALERNKLVPVAIGRPRISKEFLRTETRFFAKDFFRSENLGDSLRGILSRVRELARADFTFDEQKVVVEYLHRRARKKEDREFDTTEMKPFARFERTHEELRFVVVPSGKFMMGAKEAEFVSARVQQTAEKNECWDRPRFHARVSAPFLMMQSPFTFRMGKWLRSTHPRAPHLNTLSPEGQGDEMLDRPVTSISWRQVVDLCGFLTRDTGFLHRLPSEVEWEYVARGGTDSAYWFGDKADPRKAIYDHRYYYEAETYTEPVGAKVRSAGKNVCPKATADIPHDLGPRFNSVTKMVDMLGNVYEWTADNPGVPYRWLSSLEARHQSAFANGSSVRIIRGGCYSSKPEMLRCAARASRNEDARDPRIGFRLVRECRRHVD